VLLKGDHKVLGLTTAATIWLAAAVGLAAGAGLLTLAVLVTVFSVGALVLLAPLSEMLEQIGNERMRRKGRTVIRDE
jgi:putative Mg2+ transporter-C (MgtC) family protein